MINYGLVTPRAFGFKSVRPPEPRECSVPELLSSLRVGQSPEEVHQALHQCPNIVRAAIGAQRTLWFLARSYSPYVRTFAHAVVASVSMNAALRVIYGSVPGCDEHGMRPKICVQRWPTASVPGLGGIGRTIRSLPYQTLHYFGQYLERMAASGVGANMMGMKDWAHDTRPNRPVESYWSDSCVGNPGAVAFIDCEDFEYAKSSHMFVRTPHGFMEKFSSAVVPALQPFFSDEFSTVQSGCAVECKALYVEKLGPPVTLLKRPRSTKSVSYIPQALVTGVEMLSHELPQAMQFIQANEDWKRYVSQESKRYMEQREDHALKAMAQRDGLTEWLAHYDAKSAIGYATPSIEPKSVQFYGQGFSEKKFQHSPTLTVAGLNDNTPPTW